MFSPTLGYIWYLGLFLCAQVIGYEVSDSQKEELPYLFLKVNAPKGRKGFQRLKIFLLKHRLTYYNKMMLQIAKVLINYGESYTEV